MTTGAGIYDIFNVKIGEVGSGFYDTTSANVILSNANINMVDKKIQEFQATNKITREMEPLILVTGSLTPSNGQINVSPTSLVVPNYYSLITLKVTSPYRDRTLTKYTKERPYEQFQSDYTSGDARYPRHYFTNGVLNIEPTNATSCIATYFRTPITIDVTDSTTQINYNEKLVQLLIDEAMIIAGISSRDSFIVQNSVMQEQKNP